MIQLSWDLNSKLEVSLHKCEFCRMTFPVSVRQDESRPSCVILRLLSQVIWAYKIHSFWVSEETMPLGGSWRVHTVSGGSPGCCCLSSRWRNIYRPISFPTSVMGLVPSSSKRRTVVVSVLKTVTSSGAFLHVWSSASQQNKPAPQ